jgi:hypothetical protein
MPTLFEKSGAEGTYRRFKFEMQRIVARNDLPGFLLTLGQGEHEPILHMVRRDQVNEAEQIAWTTNPRASRPRQAPKPETTADPSPLPLLRPLLRILSDRSIERIRSDFPGWDVQALKVEFDSWIGENPVREP